MSERKTTTHDSCEKLTKLHYQELFHFGDDKRLVDLQKQMLHELESSFTSVPETYVVALKVFDSYFLDEKIETYLGGLKNLHDRLLDEGRTVKNVLKYLNENYGLKSVYYAGSGWDRIPKETLGDDKVIHMSKEENVWVEGSYFRVLGKGIKVKGDYTHSPFRDDCFDATLLVRAHITSALGAMGEFRRVTKDNGLIIIGEDRDNPDNFASLSYSLKDLKKICLPEDCKSNHGFNIAVYMNVKRPVERGSGRNRNSA